MCKDMIPYQFFILMRYRICSLILLSRFKIYGSGNYYLFPSLLLCFIINVVNGFLFTKFIYSYFEISLIPLIILIIG